MTNEQSGEEETSDLVDDITIDPSPLFEDSEEMELQAFRAYHVRMNREARNEKEKEKEGIKKAKRNWAKEKALAYGVLGAGMFCLSSEFARMYAERFLNEQPLIKGIEDIVTNGTSILVLGACTALGLYKAGRYFYHWWRERKNIPGAEKEMDNLVDRESPGTEFLLEHMYHEF